MACTSYKPTVAPHGGRKPLYGTNPLAFSWPRPEGDPVTFDQASATMARGDIQIHKRDGKPVPEGVTFPSIDEGLAGVAFVTACVESSRRDGAWVKFGTYMKR